jgi:hypothetical protein
MVQRASVRRLLLGLVMSLALAGVGMTLPVIPGAVQLARAQILAEFQEALAPYGHWERHPRWGAIWLPDDVPPDWRPYEYGHWVYTDEWGWYWISDPEEVSLPPRTEPTLLFQWEDAAWLGSGIRTRTV